MNKEQIKIQINETLKKVLIIKDYFKEKQKYEDAAKMRDIVKILRNISK